MTRCAKAVQRQRSAGQRVAGTHHTHILAVVESQVVKRHGLAALGPAGDFGQHRGEVANRQVAAFLVEQTARITRGQGHDTNGHTGGFKLKCFYQPGYQLGSCRISHGQHKRGVGAGGDKFARCQGLLQLLQRFPHRRPDRERAGRGRHRLTAALHQLIAQCVAQAAQCVADGGLGQGQVACRTGQAAFRHDFIKNPEQVQVQGAKVGWLQPGPPFFGI